MPTSRTGPLTRRTLLGAVVAAAGLSGCSVGGPAPEARPSRGRSTPAGEVSPDVAVATDALAVVRRVRGAVVGTVRRFPALRDHLSGLAALHLAHDRVLADAAPQDAPSDSRGAPYRVPTDRAKALKRLRAAEQDLHDRFGDLAGRAESGDFARLLAAMGAAVAQRLEEWPG